MDFFDSRYFSINKKLLRYMGLWPYQNRLAKILIRTFFGLSTLLAIVPHIITLFVYSKVDKRKVLHGTTIICYILGTTAKMLMSIIAEDKVKIMYKNIAQNWKMMENEEEVKILLKHSRIGRFLTIAYMAYMFSALIGFITMPMLPLLIDKIAPLNESRPLIFIIEGEYLVDGHENYKKIFVFESLTCIMTVFIFSTVDSTYVVCVQQGIGLMEVVKIRLGVAKKMIKQSEITNVWEKDAVHNSVIETVQLHQKAIHFANVLESTFTQNFLVAIGTNTSIMCFGATVIIMNLNRPMQVFRYTMIYIGLMIHMLYMSWPGQQMIDISEDIRNDVYSNQWYEFPLKTQKILRFMMMRCKEPCQLTAGGVYVMNVANCGTILKTSLSYFTIFGSMVYDLQ